MRDDDPRPGAGRGRGRAARASERGRAPAAVPHTAGRGPGAAGAARRGPAHRRHRRAPPPTTSCRRPATPRGRAGAAAEHAGRRRRAPARSRAAADAATRVAPSAMPAWKLDKKLAHDRRRRRRARSSPPASCGRRRGDGVQDAIRTPASTRSTTRRPSAAGVELQTAMQAANVLYLDVGSYANVNPATLKSVEPSLVYVAGDAPARAGRGLGAREGRAVDRARDVEAGRHVPRAVPVAGRAAGARAARAVPRRPCSSAAAAIAAPQDSVAARARASCRTSRTPARPNAPPGSSARARPARI